MEIRTIKMKDEINLAIFTSMLDDISKHKEVALTDHVRIKIGESTHTVTAMGLARNQKDETFIFIEACHCTENQKKREKALRLINEVKKDIKNSTVPMTSDEKDALVRFLGMLETMAHEKGGPSGE